MTTQTSQYRLVVIVEAESKEKAVDKLEDALSYALDYANSDSELEGMFDDITVVRES